jgi:hypothetical protein
VIHQSIPYRLARRLALAALALVFGPGIGTAQADDQGPRYHAEGQYDVSNSTYRVVAGDNLDGIAERFGVTVEELMKVNKLPSTKIESASRW